ncbi:MAG: sulfite exporter TauE/SafE family protein [Spirochaetota bacterium]
MKNTTIPIVDMVCSACETRIATHLSRVDGVASAQVSQKAGCAVIEYDESRTTIQELKHAIEKSGYTIGEGKAGTAVAVGIGTALAALYIFANAAGVFNEIPEFGASLGYGMLFVVGLLTSVHCVAMCGGISLSQSVRRLGESRIERNAPPAAGSGGAVRRLTPGFFYNAGRVVSYTLIGGIVGGLGAVFSFSSAMKGMLAAIAGLFMVLLGLKMLGVLSGLPRLSRLMPTPIRNRFGRFSSASGKRGPFAVGLLNGLMPCGPLQTMQLYALGTGSPWAGALSMFIFSLGTVPLMLIFSFAAALIPRKFFPAMLKASAVLVMFLGVITFSRAATVAGFALPDIFTSRAGFSQRFIDISGRQFADQPWNRSSSALVEADVGDGVQTVVTDFGSSGYYIPFAVQVGIPVKWTIKVSADGLNGCNNPIAIPSYGIQKTLEPGDNLIEFTPRKEGVVVYTCWMGMISSRITVVKDLGDGAPLASTEN